MTQPSPEVKIRLMEAIRDGDFQYCAGYIAALVDHKLITPEYHAEMKAYLWERMYEFHYRPTRST